MIISSSVYKHTISITYLSYSMRNGTKFNFSITSAHTHALVNLSHRLNLHLIDCVDAPPAILYYPRLQQKHPL